MTTKYMSVCNIFINKFTDATLAVILRSNDRTTLLLQYVHCVGITKEMYSS